MSFGPEADSFAGRSGKNRSGLEKIPQPREFNNLLSGQDGTH